MLLQKPLLYIIDVLSLYVLLYTTKILILLQNSRKLLSFLEKNYFISKRNYLISKGN